MYRKLVLIVAACAVVGVASPGHAHLVDGLNLQVSKKSATRTAQVIHRVFDTRREAHEAQRVVSCESGFRVRATNGEYWGLFQMGKWARVTYDWGWSRRQQTKSSFRYYVDSGRDWSPWSNCAP